MMQDLPDSMLRSFIPAEKWEARIASSATAFLCTHIWRCTLFLCFRGEYSSALVCARASAAICDIRPVNQACCRHLCFYLQCLQSKLELGEGTSLERDEEMMAYVSGDLQGSMEDSWVWQKHELHSREIPLANAHDDFQKDTASRPAVEESRSVEGWDWILATLLKFLSEQKQQEQQGLARDQGRTAQGDVLFLAPQFDMGTTAISPGGSSRISIANII